MLFLILCLLYLFSSRTLQLFFFFFSSRRRHTRLVSDWSSDVCSSDLAGACLRLRAARNRARLCGGGEWVVCPAGVWGRAETDAGAFHRAAAADAEGDRKSVV